MVSTALYVQRHQVLPETVGRLLSEQMVRHLLRDEGVSGLCVNADQPGHQCVHAVLRLLVEDAGVSERLSAI